LPDDESFGHYLGGLIDGDGHFSTQQQLVIAFHAFDVSLAYYVKKRMGYGSVYKVKNKNAYILVIASHAGLEKIIELVNGKLRTKDKYDQVINNILESPKYIELKKRTSFSLNVSSDFKNH
jgi:hypothetical protein